MDIARLPPAERGSDGAMRLLCIITRDYCAWHALDLPSVSSEVASVSGDAADADNGMAMKDTGINAEYQEPRGPVVGKILATLGAATVALAHLQFPQPPGGVDEASRFSRGAIARFVCWICKAAPEVFPDLRDRGLLETLVELLRSCREDERADVEIAVAALAIHLDAARIPLRALGAVNPLITKGMSGTVYT